MRALPGAEFLLASVTLRIGDARDPVEPRFISARLDRSNDGQDHAFLPYAASSGFALVASPDFGAVRLHAAGPHEVHLALVPHSRARRSRVHRTPIHVRYDVRSPLSEDRDGETMP
jgi:hypothetical protein